MLLACPARADVARFLAKLKIDAKAAGVSSATFDEALSGFAPVPRIIELDRAQPEKRKSFAEYRKSLLGGDRVPRGRRLFIEEAKLLTSVSKAYGVSPQVVVALWGIETSYGAITGGFKVPVALATLAMDGRRPEFFRGELIKALSILEQKHIKASDMTGSWAGAMGQPQFMPSSFLAYAVDWDGDGRRDIWNTRGDVFASAANYLAKSGWKAGEPWGVEVKIPPGIDVSPLCGLEKKLSMGYWQEMGVSPKAGGSLSGLPSEASLVMPDGPSGDAFLVFNNYRVLMTWNRATYFASAVGLLADSIAAR